MASPGNQRRRPEAWELRASVSEDTFALMTQEADALGRSRTWHVGLVVEAMAHVSRHLTPKERARLDYLLNDPAELLAVLRPAVADPRPAERRSATG